MEAAQQHCSPLESSSAGRRRCDGEGSLKEIDHVPFVAPLTRSQATAQSAGAGQRACRPTRCACCRHAVGVALSISMDPVFSVADDDCRPGALTNMPAPLYPTVIRDEQRALLADAQRPVSMAGTK